MKCIFCQNKANSKEHIWGAWLGKVYPATVTGDAPKMPHVEDRNDQYGKIVPSRGQFKGGEHPFQKTSKVVCTECNNTWMSQIEEGMANNFESLMRPTRNSFDSGDFEKVKIWCFLKYCVIESACEFPVPELAFQYGLQEVAVEVAEQARRRRNENFRETLEVPGDFFVYVGRAYKEVQYGGSYCIHSDEIGLFPDRSVSFKEQKSFLGCLGDMHFLVTNHSALIGFVHSKYFSRKDGVAPFANPKFRVTELPLAAMNSDTFEDDICTFLEKREKRTLRRNFLPFKGEVHIVRPRKRK